MASFSPIAPPLCPNEIELPYRYVGGISAADTELPLDVHCSSTTGPCPHYINNITNHRRIYTNWWTDTIGFKFESFSTERDIDFLSLGDLRNNGYSPENHYEYSGEVFPGWVYWSTYFGATNLGGTFQAKPAFLDFYSDRSYTKPGFSISRFRACRRLGEPTPDRTIYPLAKKGRNVGFLLGTNDVIYTEIVPNHKEPEPAYGAPPNNVTIAMWSQDPANDFDLYVMCQNFTGQTPPANLNWEDAHFKSISTSGQEFLLLPNTVFAYSQCERVLVAVTSYNGAGAFNLTVSEHFPTMRKVLTAGFDENMSLNAELVKSVAKTLGLGQRGVYGATEGALFIETIELYASTSKDCSDCRGGPCDICIQNLTGASNSHVCNSGRAALHTDAWYFKNPEIVTHELLHHDFCIKDEYVAGCIDSTTNSCVVSFYENGCHEPKYMLSCHQCGHTVMANSWNSSHNLCTNRNHSTDYPQLDAPDRPLPTLHQDGHRESWLKGVNAMYWHTSGMTPDTYNYADFDFSGTMSVMVIHPLFPVPAFPISYLILFITGTVLIGLLSIRRIRNKIGSGSWR